MHGLPVMNGFDWLLVEKSDEEYVSRVGFRKWEEAVIIVLEVKGA